MKTRGAAWSALVAFAALLPAGVTLAQEAAQGSAPPALASAAPSWEFELTGSLFAFPEQDDVLQPTLRADRGRLRLETRYNYEDKGSLSLFAGAGFAFGSKVKLALVPMLGGLVGRTDGVVPALDLDLTVGPFELYGEGELVISVEDASSSFLYVWSELSWWATEWLRVGAGGQRTRLYQAERDIMRGPLAGVVWKRVSGSVYWFNPGADDWVVVASVGVSF